MNKIPSRDKKIWDAAVEACAKMLERRRVRVWLPAEGARQIRTRLKFTGGGAREEAAAAFEDGQAVE